MKMKKNFKFYAIIWAVFLALFNALVFLIRPFMPWFEGFSDPQFWIAWAFILVSFIANLLCAYKAFREENLKKLFYRLPLITVIVCVVITAISAVAVLRADWAGEVVNATHEKVKTQTQFIKLLAVDAESLLDRAKSDAVKTECKKVYEAVRYSDPMSNDALSVIEAKITVKMDELSSAVGADDAAKAKEIADELVILVGDRNKKCRALK